MGIIERNIGNLHDQDTGALVGYHNPVTGKQEELNAPALQALVSGDGNGLVPSRVEPNTGADVRAALQAEIDALTPGKRLFLRAGEYLVGRDVSFNWCLKLTANNTGIVGAGMGATVIKVISTAPSSACVIRGDSLTAPLIANLTVDGNNSRPGTNVLFEGEGVNLKGSLDARLENVEARNTEQDGFDLDDATGAVLIGCVARDCWGNGYHLAGASTFGQQCVMTGCYSYRCGQERSGSDPFGEGYSIAGRGVLLQGCISVGDQRGFTVDGNGQLIGCYALDSGNGATPDFGIRTLTNASAAVISGCVVSRTTNSTTATGIAASVGNSVTVQGCTVTACGTGVQLGGTNNSVVDCTIVSPASQGVLVTGAAGNWVVKGNMIRFPGHGVRAESASGQIIGNVIASPTEQGIDLRADGIAVLNNRVVGGAKFGVRMFDGNVDNAVVCFNTLNATSGGVSTAGTGHTVAANIINGTYTA